uniref:Uncharacterized protein n=1 Tax=Arundo donax TaxID=35708 RepID=A0A0A9C5I3_ARUDO
MALFLLSNRNIKALMLKVCLSASHVNDCMLLFLQ